MMASRRAASPARDRAAPYFSNSLSEWAAGNEICSLSGVDGAYRNAHSLEACHQFKMAMGATNITHFAPLNRDMWRYYHELALTQMAECRSYAEMPAAFYGNFDDVLPASQTEVHECERLAMAYEMFAQHFLQDAWSVGHMWNAWGATTLDGYPADVELLPDEAPLPAIDVPGRRALIGALVGIARGMVHGAKSYRSR